MTRVRTYLIVLGAGAVAIVRRAGTAARRDQMFARVTCAALTVIVVLVFTQPTEAAVYWANSGTGTVGRANSDGSAVAQNFICCGDLPGGVAVDAGHVYWADGASPPGLFEAVGRANIDGSGVMSTFISGAQGNFGVAVDASHVYWTNPPGDTIERANIDGTAATPFFISASTPRGVAVDGSHIYWANDTGSIGRANIDGSGPTQTFITGASNPRGVAVDGSHIYWANYGAGTIGRANIDGTGITESFVTGASNPVGIAVDSQAVATLPSNTAPPAVSGLPVFFLSLTCSPGSWSGTQPIVFAYQWYRDGIPLPGETGPVHRFVPADLSSALACQVTATNSVGRASATAYLIDEPPVRAPSTPLQQVRFVLGDHVAISADGCVQTGGAGRTWKRYVDPGARQRDLYYGDVGIIGTTGSDPLPFGPLSQAIDHTIVINRPAAYLALGYEDDNYTDNGYYSHDNGTGDQCSGAHGYGGPAFVKISVVPGPSVPAAHECETGARPFDLLVAQRGVNGEPLNPEWTWQCDYYDPLTQAAPTASSPNRFHDAFNECNRFRLVGGPFHLHLDAGNCSSKGQISGWDIPADGIHSTCDIGADFSNSVHGHVNWQVVTYRGVLQWDSWASPDDDFNFRLFTGAGPASAPGPPQANTATPPGAVRDKNVVSSPRNWVQLEFMARETINWFTSSPWRALMNAAQLDRILPRPPPSRVSNLVDGTDAVATGLLGFDVEHGAEVELHPLYAFAIHEKRSTPTDDKWMIFARNTGTEGWCSSKTHTWNTRTITVLLPSVFPGTNGSNGATGTFTSFPPRLGRPTIADAAPGGAVSVSFNLPKPGVVGTLGITPFQAGEVDIHWLTNASSRIGTSPPRFSLPPVSAEGESGTVESLILRLIRNATGARRGDALALLPHDPTPHLQEDRLTARHVRARAPSMKRHPSAGATTLSLLSRQLYAWQKQTMIALCVAVNGRGDKRLVAACKQLSWRQVAARQLAALGRSGR